MIVGKDAVVDEDDDDESNGTASERDDKVDCIC
jgi:hypothetical protein